MQLRFKILCPFLLILIWISSASADLLVKLGEEVLVSRKDGHKISSVKSSIRAISNENSGLRNISTFRLTDSSGIKRIQDGGSGSGSAVVTANTIANACAGIIAINPELNCEANSIRKISVVPNDPGVGVNQIWGIHKISAPVAWDIATGSKAVKVAVIDTGIDYTHPDLANNMAINASEISGDGIDNDGNGYIDDVYGYDFANNDGNPIDDHNHGTHVSGTIGAVGNNSVGIAGINWNVGLIAIKVLKGNGSGYDSDVVRGIDYAITRGANVINMSLGGPYYSKALEDAISRANTAGILVAAAAGNESANNDLTPSFPANFSLPNIISVASTTSSDSLSSFSNYGTNRVHIAAPGSAILSTIIGGYGTMSGTSMATPHIAGAAALIKSAKLSLTMFQVKDLILNYATSIPGLSGKVITSSRLNVANSVAAAIGTTPNPITPNPTPTPVISPPATLPGTGGGGSFPDPQDEWRILEASGKFMANYVRISGEYFDGNTGDGYNGIPLLVECSKIGSGTTVSDSDGFFSYRLGFTVDKNLKQIKKKRKSGKSIIIRCSATDLELNFTTPFTIKIAAKNLRKMKR